MSAQLLSTVARLLSSRNRSKATAPTPSKSWRVAKAGSLVEVSFGRGPSAPIYAALHTESSFLRLNYGPRSAWGTSIILLPALWVAGSYHQGGQIRTAWRKVGAELEISFAGSISGLKAQGQIRLSPPESNSISGTVTVNVDGDVSLDRRPREAFKPVTLSSMHISADDWDAQSAESDTQSFPIPAWGWVISPPVAGRRFGLKAGSSNWKINAPTLEIELDEGREIAGWKTPSCNPNDDNLSVWAATDDVIRSWRYTFTAKP